MNSKQVIYGLLATAGIFGLAFNVFYFLEKQTVGPIRYYITPFLLVAAVALILGFLIASGKGQEQIKHAWQVFFVFVVCQVLLTVYLGLYGSGVTASQRWLTSLFHGVVFIVVLLLLTALFSRSLSWDTDKRNRFILRMFLIALALSAIQWGWYQATHISIW